MIGAHQTLFRCLEQLARPVSLGAMLTVGCNCELDYITDCVSNCRANGVSHCSPERKLTMHWVIHVTTFHKS